MINGMERGRIHPTALVSERATLGAGVTVGAYAVVNDHVTVGDGAFVGAQVILGEPLAACYDDDGYTNPPLTIGARAVLRSGSIVYAGSTIGDDFACGHRVTIREQSRIGDHVRVGTFGDVQGRCEIGDYARLHSGVFVGEHSVIGRFAWLFPHVVLTNDPHPPSPLLQGVRVEEFAVVAARAVLLPGVTVGRDAVVGAGALVREDVPAEMLAVGTPARVVRSVRSIRSRETGESVYPWREHFDRGMPWAGVGYAAWAAGQPTGTVPDA